MPEPIGIKVQLTIDKDKSQSEINSKIKQMKLEKATIELNVDGNSLKSLNKQLKDIGKIMQDANRQVKIRLIDPEEIAKGNKLIFDSAENAKKHFQKIGDVKSVKTYINEVTKEVKSFTVELQHANNVVEKLKFDMAKVDTGRLDANKNPILTNVYELTNRNVNDYVLKAKEEQSKALLETQKIQKKIEQAQHDTAAAYNKYANEKLQKEEQISRQAEANALKEKQRALEYEKWWINAIDKREKKEIDSAYKLEKFQQDMQIKAQNLQTRYGRNVDKVELNRILSETKSLTPVTANLTQAQDKLSQSFKKLHADASQASHTIGNTLLHNMEKAAEWAISMGSIYGTMTFFTEGFQYVNDLNKSMTEISIVTNSSQKQVDQLAQSYQNLGNELSITTSELAKGSAELYRQGLNTSEVENRLEQINKFAKVSSLDFKVATELITASTNSMSTTVEKASDIITYLGDSTASGSDEIAIAFQKVGGSAGALNIEMEKVGSWIAAISSRTRESASTIGNSVKSILARIQNLKEKGFNEEDGTKINEVSSALASVGVALTDNQGQFRDFGQVMDELGARWESLDSRQKAYISTTVDAAA